MSEHRRGTPEWALARVARGYHGVAASDACDCHGAAGAWIRENEARLAGESGAALMLLATQRGHVTHAAVSHSGGLWHGPDSMIVERQLGYRVELSIPIGGFLRRLWREGAEPASAPRL